MRHRLEIHWEVGPVEEEGECRRFVPATVPGSVQRDWARGEGWDDVEWLGNAGDYNWMEASRWRYRATLPARPTPPGRRAVLVLEGVDYEAEVRVGGEVVARRRGMLRPIEVELEALDGQVVEVTVEPAPLAERPGPPRRQAAGAVKPAVSYGWDFHPRLIPLGLWRPAYVELRPTPALADAEVSYALTDDLSSAEVTLTLTLDAAPPEPVEARWTLADDRGETVHDETWRIEGAAETRGFRLPAPRLWWPNGHGGQPLYASRVTVGGEAIEGRVGFRRVRLVMHEGAWDRPAAEEWPKTRSDPPMTLEVNGRRVFAKGGNFVSPRIFPGELTRDVYAPLLNLARDSHFNLLRCWGGAVPPTCDFYDLCDELGLMVWQEFPLACNRYDESRAYLDTLDLDSKRLIIKRRRHASLALWCGGNELFNSWSGMTDQHPALRLLARNCYDLDPRTPFYPTMPVGGVGHGCYLFRLRDGRTVFDYFPAGDCTAYTEFGVPGPAPRETIDRVIPENERFPPRLGTEWERRHAFRSWDSVPESSWMEIETVRHFFGEPRDLGDLLDKLNWLQCEGLRFCFEEARRQRPRCSMALNWCFNEPWPTAANNSVVAWPDRPKPALAAVASACRPALASARVPRFDWRAGEAARLDLYVLNDGPADDAPLRVEVAFDGGEPATWDVPPRRENANVVGPSVDLIVPDGPPGELWLRLRCPGQPEFDNAYRLLRRTSP